MKRTIATILIALGLATLARAQVTIPWSDVSKTGSSLANLQTRNFSDLQNVSTGFASFMDALTVDNNPVYDTDYLLFRSAAGGMRRMLPSGFYTATFPQYVAGLTALGGALDASADRIPVYDSSIGSVRWVGQTQILTGSAASMTVDASGFSGNLSPSDDTLQEIANAVDALTGSGALNNVVEDTTPQLGGTLDLNGQSINTGANTLSPTEMSYLDGVTSAIQTQINAKISSTATNAGSFGFVVDEDDMASNSATKLPTQQSVRAYVSGGFASLSGSYDDPSWIIGLDWAKIDTTSYPLLADIDGLSDADGLAGYLHDSIEQLNLDVTGQWTFPKIPQTSLTALGSGTELTQNTGYTRDFDGTETTLTFSAGTPADGTVIYLIGTFSDTTLIHFPSSYIQNDQATGTDLTVPASAGAVHTFTWRYEEDNTRWILQDTVPRNIRVATKVTATNYTVGTDDASELYGGIIYVTGSATITIPAVAAGANFKVIVVGANTVSVDPNASDLIILNGTALDDGDKITSGGTTGEVAEIYYYNSTGWYASTSGWSDGGP